MSAPPHHLHDEEALFQGHDSPAARAMRATTQQVQRARRAEIVRQRQREALLELLVRTMDEMHISMSELSAARRTLAAWKPPARPDEGDDEPSA